MAKNIAKNDVTLVFSLEKKGVTSAGKGDVLCGMGDTQSQLAQRVSSSPRRITQLIRLKASTKPVSSTVLLLRAVAPKNAGMAKVARDKAAQILNKIVRSDYDYDSSE